MGAESEQDIRRCIQIGLLCVQDDATNRPTMSEVNIMLRSHFSMLPNPSQPTFVMNGNAKMSAEGSSPALLNCNDRSKSKLTVTTEDSETFTDVYVR